ncbi:hypothetical protein O6H91_11G112800 [Diphasiastrum complanatum]|nr:hypothetical protein O6H91_11G112800 [Diphasiastrum complanatum]
MHVVMFPLPGTSHIIPACYLAKKLAAHGLFITFLCPDNVIDPGRAQLLTQDPNINLVAFPENKFVLEGWSKSESVFDVLIEFAQASLKLRGPFETFMEELMLTHAASPICIISDNFLSWTQDIADKYKIPRYILDTSPAQLVALIFSVRTLKAQGLLPLSSSSSSTLSIPGLAPFPTRDCFSCLLDSNPKYLQDFFIEQFSRVHEAAGTIINTFYELEAKTIEALRASALNPNKIGVWPVGPLLPSQLLQPTLVSGTISQEVGQSIDKICMQWLDTRSVSSVLYVSFGSMFRASVAQIQEIELGLKASDQPFLWVLHSPPVSQSSEPASFCGLPGVSQSRVSGRGLILSCWAPQQLILSHPSTGGFMTHCGWNSTLESITMGVPTIAAPQFGDQRTNCRLMVELLKMGVEAVRGADGIVDRKEVERAVRYVMASKEGIAMRKRAQELGDSAKKAVAAGGSSEANLQAFVRHLQSSTSGTCSRLTPEPASA